MRIAYILVGNPEGKRLLGRPRRRWEDNIEMDLKGIGSKYGPMAGLPEYGNAPSVSITAGNLITS
jgi:hypothetical protein